MPEPGPQKSYTIWNRPWRGPRGMLGWLAMLAGAVFVLVLVLILLTWENTRPVHLVMVSALVGIGVAGGGAALMGFGRWIRRPANLRRLLFAVACLVTLVVLIYALENWRGKRAWENYRRQWEAKGEQFSFTALVPASVPDNQNFALAPLLSPPLNFHRGPQGIVWKDTNGLARLEKLSARLRHKYETNELAPGRLEKGTFADLEATAELYRGNTNYPQAAPEAPPASTVLTALAKFETELNDLHQASTSRPYARFPIDYSYEPYSAILLPHLAPVKNVAQVLQVRATAELEANHPSEAFADLKLSFRLADSLREEPILIDHLVRISMLAMSLQTLREGLARHAWSETQLKEIQTYLDSLDILAEYKRCIRGERAAMVGELNYLRRHPAAILNLLDYRGSEQAASTPMPFQWMPAGWFYQNMITISKMHQDFFLPTVDERAHRVFPQINENGARAFDALRVGPYTIFAKLLFPALGKAVQRSAQMQVFVDAARIACALERCRLANGALPETLDALKPAFIEDLPLDLIDGKLLRYRRDPDGGYILYSVGWNQTDDGGTLGVRKKNQGSSEDPDLLEGDWVWQMPGKK